MTDVLELIIEVHDNGHSSLNRNWGWDKVLKLEANGNWQTNSYKVISTAISYHRYFFNSTSRQFLQKMLIPKNINVGKIIPSKLLIALMNST